MKIKPNSEDKKTLKKGQVVFAMGSGLYVKLPNIYITQYDKSTKAQKKKITVQNRTENLIYIQMKMRAVYNQCYHQKIRK